jgi:hypothetical protein
MSPANLLRNKDYGSVVLKLAPGCARAFSNMPSQGSVRALVYQL